MAVPIALPDKFSAFRFTATGAINFFKTAYRLLVTFCLCYGCIGTILMLPFRKRVGVRAKRIINGLFSKLWPIAREGFLWPWLAVYKRCYIPGFGIAQLGF